MECRVHVPDHEACIEFEDEFTDEIVGERPARIRDFAAVPDASGWEVYFSLVDEHGNFVRAPGTVKFVLAENPGIRVNEFLVLETEVWPEDYDEARIGIQQRETVAYRTHLSRDDIDRQLLNLYRSAARRGEAEILIIFEPMVTDEQLTGVADFRF